MREIATIRTVNARGRENRYSIHAKYFLGAFVFPAVRRLYFSLFKRVLTISEFKEGHSRDFVFDLPEPFTPWLNTFRPFHDICCFRLIQLVFNEMNESALILALKFAPRLTRYLGGVWSETAETWNLAQTHPLGHPARWKQFPYHYYSKSLNYSMLSQIVFFSLFCSSSQSLTPKILVRTQQKSKFG